MDADNLKGTARTLDGADGACPLEDGIMSRRGIVSLDDSHSLILTDDGWIEPRNEATDVYLFAYKTNHLDALRDYYKLTGNPPMIPRYALGNWWSRYYKYTQQEYENLMLKFKEKRFAVFLLQLLIMDCTLQKYLLNAAQAGQDLHGMMNCSPTIKHFWIFSITRVWR